MPKFAFSRFLMLSITPLLLAACESVLNPTFMPAGYAHHQKEFKSPPGPPAPDIGYDYTPADNAEVLARWQAVVDDLLLQALANGVSLPAVIDLQTDLKPGVFRNSFDAALRESLQKSGYQLSNDPDNSMPVFFSAYEPGKRVYSENERPYNGELPPVHKDGAYMPPSQEMELVLGIPEAGVLTNAVSGHYTVPLYGFTPGHYVETWESPLKPASVASEEEARASYNN